MDSVEAVVAQFIERHLKRRYRPGPLGGDRRSSSGSLAMLVAMRRASSQMSSLAGEIAGPGSSPR